jgi:hypothetical protein
MSNNKEIVRSFIEKMIEVGSELASKNYMIIVLSSATNELKKDYPFMKHISLKVDGGVMVDSDIDEIDKNELAMPLNKVYDYLFVENSKKMLKDKLDEGTMKDFEYFGLHI